MKPFRLPFLQLLSAQDERELSTRYEAGFLPLLPLLGPLFGLGVISFAGWDYLIDPARAPLTLAVRCLFVLLGSLACLPTLRCWTPIRRCRHLYWSYACAVVICVFLLQDGFRYGLACITGIVFAGSVLTLRVKTFLLILSLPALLFVVLGAIRMPWFEFFSSLILYLMSVGLACIAMLVTRSFSQKAFLLEKQLLDVARHDSLTGACDRRYLEELAEREIALARRHDRALAVAMLDIDHFKHVNDTYGHHVGDEVIKQVVAVCVGNLRGIDHFGRIGGEEFACVLPETTESEALRCAERLRGSIEVIKLQLPEGALQFTISIGVVVLNPDHAGWSALLKDADGAMYCAKHSGRNRVVLAAPPTAAHSPDEESAVDQIKRAQCAKNG